MSVAIHHRPVERKPARIDARPGSVPVVTRWGQVGGLVLRPGDRLLPGSGATDLLLIGPRGRGRPMLAVRRQGRLIALPGWVPASEERWRVLGTVGIVERQLERGAPDLGPQWVCFAIHPRTASADLDGARRAFRDGRYTGAGLHGICLRATLASERYGVDVGVAMAPTRARAEALRVGLEGGLLRFPLVDEAKGTVIVGPWGPSTSSGISRTESSPSRVPESRERGSVAGRDGCSAPGRASGDGWPSSKPSPRRRGGRRWRPRARRASRGAAAADRQMPLPFAADSAGA